MSQLPVGKDRLLIMTLVKIGEVFDRRIFRNVMKSLQELINQLFFFIICAGVHKRTMKLVYGFCTC